MAKLGLNLGFLLFQIFNFAVLCILLYAWAYKPILKMLDNRKQKIAQGLEDARIASEARANAEQDAAKILAEAQTKANQVVRESLDEKRQHTLIDEFFSGVRAGKVEVLEGTTISGASAEVTSALPLSSGEMTSVKNDILSKVGSQATVSFRVDPSILGGLVIRVGGKVLDASVAGQLESLRQSIS